MSKASDVISTAAAVDAKLSAIDAVAARIDALRSRSSDLGAEFSALVEGRNARNLAATLAEAPLPPDDTQESGRLREIKAEIAAAEAAMPVLSAEKDQLTHSLPALRRSHAEAFLRWKAEQTRAAIDLAADVLANLQLPIARLSALAVTQKATLGASFDVGPDINDLDLREGLLSTGDLAFRLIEGLPKRLVPAALSPEQLTPAAEAAQAEFRKELGQ